jgi:septal ring factor EnvC (AmiA/AmiB activator)
LRSRIGAMPLIIALVCLGAVALGMWVKDREQVEAMSAERAQMTATMNQTMAQSKSQIQELNNRIDMLTMAQAKAQAPAAKPAAHPVRKAAAVSARRKPVEANDPRVDRLQGQLADTQQELARQRDDLTKTRDDLNGSIAQTRDALAKSHDDLSGQINSARTDLSGSIAKTHDEVIALRKRGEQNIYEFQLGKSKQFQRVGPLSVALRSANTKHKTYDLAMIVEDNQLSKKHVNLYEPVWIRLSDRPQAVELVVNRVDKDHVSGYLSEPKYKRSELASSSEKAPEKPLQLETR